MTVKRKIGFVSKGLAMSAWVALMLSGAALADSDADVLERIRPIGKVNVKQPAAPAAPAAAPAAPEAAAPAPEAPVAAPAEAAPAAAPAEAAPAAAAAGGDPMALAQAKGCLACHQVDVKVVGPAYKDVAAKYKGDAGAVDMLVQKVKAGGSGTWGTIPMPPNAHVSDDDIRVLVEWIVTL